DRNVTGVQTCALPICNDLVIKFKSTHRCLLSRYVTIKGKNNLATRSIVGDEPSCNTNMSFTKCSPAGGYSSSNSSKMRRHDIGRPFDHNKLPLYCDLIFSQDKPVQYPGFLTEGGFRRVQIFRPVVIIC